MLNWGMAIELKIGESDLTSNLIHKFMNLIHVNQEEKNKCYILNDIE